MGRDMTAAARVARDKTAEGRWHGRPLLSAAVLVAAHGIPIVAAVATSAILSRRLHAPASLLGAVAQWGLLFAASTAVLLVVDRGSKRLLPLAALLKLSMLFPDAAPKRLTVARKSGSIRNLQARLEEAKALGADDEPTRAAEVILALVGALHAHDRHTRGHSERVRWFTDLLAEELKLPAADRDRLRWAALLHDIGKLHVSPKILNKPGKLVRREWRHIHRHPENGARIVAPLAPWLGEWAATVEQHHEKYDGSGYPHRLRGEEISLGARIVAVADAYEVMTAVRSYKKAASAATARKELTRSAGTHFDPAIVRAFLNVSIGRLRWVTGPVAWVAQIPFVGWLPRLAEGAAAVGGQAAGAVGTAAVLSGGSVFVAGHEPIAVPDDTTTLEVPTDVATPPPVDETPTTVATRVLGEALHRSGSTSTAGSGTSVSGGSTAPAPAPVVQTHDNPSTKDDKVVTASTTDTTSLPPTATANRQAPADNGGGPKAKTDPITSTVDSVLPSGKVKGKG
jgi:putative nucleotidyltransferase with HDIG domain